MSDLPKRASIVGDADPLADMDLSKWNNDAKPRRLVHEPAIVSDAAKEAGFVSREAKPVRRRRKTHRTHQLNLKLTKEAKMRFEEIADANDWTFGAAFEKLLDEWDAQKNR